MVCRNEEQRAPICWDDKIIYGFVAEPTKNQKKLISAVNKLPIICRKVVILYAFEGMQREDIAGMMQTSLAAIRFIVHRSGLLLQEYLANQGIKDSALCNYGLKRVFADWPCLEYARLVELRKNMVFLE